MAAARSFLQVSQKIVLSRNSPLVRFVPRRTAVECSMAAKKVKVAVAQMCSTNDLIANFETCNRLAKFWPDAGIIEKIDIDAILAVYVDNKPGSLAKDYNHRPSVLEAAAAGAELLCFPENFSFVGAKEGESLKIAESLDGPIMQRYCSLARDSKIWLSLGGFQEKSSEDSHICNTHVLVDDSGNIREKYQKIHLFDVDVPGNMVYKESRFTTPGNRIVVADSPSGLLGLTVCYDLRFPELYQQLRFQHQAQVLLVPSAFTKVTGEAHWEILLRSRAIETQCYVIAAAQAGKHSEKRESYGDSLIIDPWGRIIGRMPDRLSTGIAVAEIDLSLVKSVRERMPISEHRRTDIYERAFESNL